MTGNIQDAESAIRDVDAAEEMMARPCFSFNLQYQEEKGVVIITR